MEEIRNSVNHSFRIVIPGDHRYVKTARRFVMSVCRLAGVGDDDRNSLGLALTEILNNSIDHGVADETSPIDVEFDIEAGQIRMLVRESGRGSWEGPDMDRVERETRTPCPDDTQFRGRGLLLVCSLMDEMRVRSSGDGATVVEVVKRREQA